MSIRIALRWVFFSSISEDDSWLRKDKRFWIISVSMVLNRTIGEWEPANSSLRGLRVIKVTKKRIYRISRKGQINMYRVPGLYFGVDITGTDKKQISMPKFDSVII